MVSLVWCSARCTISFGDTHGQGKPAAGFHVEEVHIVVQGAVQFVPLATLVCDATHHDGCRKCHRMSPDVLRSAGHQCLAKEGQRLDRALTGAAAHFSPKSCCSACFSGHTQDDCWCHRAREGGAMGKWQCSRQVQLSRTCRLQAGCHAAHRSCSLDALLQVLACLCSMVRAQLTSILVDSHAKAGTCSRCHPGLLHFLPLHPVLTVEAQVPQAACKCCCPCKLRTNPGPVRLC